MAIFFYCLIIIFLFSFFFHFQPLFLFLLQKELTSHFFKKAFLFGDVSVLQATWETAVVVRKGLKSA